MILIGLGLLLALCIGAHLAVVARQSSAFEGACQQLTGGFSSSRVETTSLPKVVFAFAERAGARANAPAGVWLRQRAKLKMAPDKPFQVIEAEQVISTNAPGFIWRAAGQMGYGLSVTVVDRYVDGEGLLDARLMGSIPVAHMTGPDMAVGELMRYLAELA